MLVIVDNVLAPYRVSLFDELGQSRGGQLTDVLTRATHRKRSRCSAPWHEVSFQADVLCTVGITHNERVFDVSFGSGRTLGSLARRRFLGGGGAALLSGDAAAAFRAGPRSWECRQSGARARDHSGRSRRVHPKILCRGVPERRRDRIARRDVDPPDRFQTTYKWG
jgi:hypothetical protein